MGDIFFHTSELSIATVVFRLLIAAVMGGLIGLEREAKSRPAGFRTYMLVALGATVAMISNQYLNFMQTGPWAEIVGLTTKTDVSRLGAQVINGVGFLGAGTILVTQRQEIKGITTAAGLWTSACLGLSIGAGFYECAIIGMLLILICMGTFSGLENRIMSNARNMNVYIEMNDYEDVGTVSASIREMGIKLFGADINKNVASDGRMCATFELYLPEKEAHELVLVKLSAIKGVRLISEV